MRSECARSSGKTFEQLLQPLLGNKDCCVKSPTSSPGVKFLPQRSKHSDWVVSQQDGGVRGIVVSDVLRRLVARTMAKQCALSAEKATALFQYALRTRAGCECVSHVLV